MTENLPASELERPELEKPTAYEPDPKGDEVAAPRDRDLAIAVAAFLLQPYATDKEAAEKLGVGERSIRRWKTCSWWRDVRNEAIERYHLDALDQAALLGLKAGLKTDPRLALAYLERRLDALKQPGSSSAGGNGSAWGGGGSDGKVVRAIEVYVVGAAPETPDQEPAEEVTAEVEKPKRKKAARAKPAASAGRKKRPRARKKKARPAGGAKKRRTRDPDT